MDRAGRKLRVAIHADGAQLRGSERQVLLVADALQRRGHAVVVSCRAGGHVEAELRRRGLRTTTVRPQGDLDLWSALRFARWLRRERPDALLLTSWKRAWVAGWAARRAGVPRVVLRVGGVHPVEGGREEWKYRRAVERYADAVIANSGAVAEHLQRTVVGFAAEERVHLVPNGIERTGPAVVGADAAAAIRVELGVTDGVLVVAVGDLQPRKGYDVLLHALAALGDPGVHLAIAGAGAELGALRALAATLGVAERVHLLGMRDDVPALLAACDLFVLSSRAEGMSVAMLEAVRAGKPIVATEVGGAWEALGPYHGRPPGGWTVPVGDAGALARALGEVVALLRSGSPSVDERVSEALWRLEHWFTLERMVDRFEAVLRGAPRSEEVARAG